MNYRRTGFILCGGHYTVYEGMYSVWWAVGGFILCVVNCGGIILMERDAKFVQKKAERATLRVHLREKYRLPQSEKDDNQIQMAGDDIELPEELQKMVAEDQVEEEEKGSFLGQMQNIQNMDMDTLKEKATATFTEMKQAAEEKCSVM
ncbi:unnamed protein product [Ranitomeya imitator]|uniref:Complexin-4 n=1 Tax=Ranitomeya imitator TaxID=111125 RepID=A0ABN9L2Y7_9NEOB|nr:unnamed protein product [Ranitomeya imitator]